jgi:hypothetical protein
MRGKVRKRSRANHGHTPLDCAHRGTCVADTSVTLGCTMSASTSSAHADDVAVCYFAHIVPKDAATVPYMAADSAPPRCY